MSGSLGLKDLGGDGGKSWLPEEIGDMISGKVMESKSIQQTDFTTGAPLFWSDEKPRMQGVVNLQTDLRDDDDDDGIRTVWLKGGENYEPKEGSGRSGMVALREALVAAGVEDCEDGGTLTVKYTGIAKPTTRGFQSAKLYKAKFEAPKASISVADLDDDF